MAPLCMLDDLWQAPPSCDISPFTFRAWPHSEAESSGTHQFTDLLREHSHDKSHVFWVFLTYLPKHPKQVDTLLHEPIKKIRCRMTYLPT